MTWVSGSAALSEDLRVAHYRKEAAATLRNSSTRASGELGRFSCLGAHAISEAQVCNTMPDAGPRVTVERLAPSSSVYVRPSEKVWEADGCGLTTAMPAV
jgi:hypothetical protein